MSAPRRTGRNESTEGTFQPLEHTPIPAPAFEPLEVTPIAAAPVAAGNESPAPTGPKED